jgi:hypothetical protein
LRLTATICALLLAGCAQDSGSAYKPEAGPLEPVVVSPVALAFPELEKDLQLRVTFPGSAGKYPLIVFSHGGRCSRDRYADFANHWASHGYVVIQPAHLDSVSIERSKKHSGTQLMVEAERTRRLDNAFILDSLDRIQELVPGLAGKIDAERIVAAGHSLGAGTAMTMTGLVLVDPRKGTEMGFMDDRFDALLLISDPSNSPLMPDDPWRAVALPTFIATGSKDFSGLTKLVKSGFAYEMREGAVLSDTPNHYLYIEGMDHYLGGLMCRDKPPEAPDYEALRIINGASTAFLDAYIKDSASAQAFLASNPAPLDSTGRAKLETR